MLLIKDVVQRLNIAVAMVQPKFAGQIEKGCHGSQPLAQGPGVQQQ
jgi:hypothetical protein